MAEFTGPERRLDIRATITLSNGTQITLQADLQVQRQFVRMR